MISVNVCEFYDFRNCYVRDNYVVPVRCHDFVSINICASCESRLSLPVHVRQNLNWIKLVPMDKPYLLLRSECNYERQYKMK